MGSLFYLDIWFSISTYAMIFLTRLFCLAVSSDGSSWVSSSTFELVSCLLILYLSLSLFFFYLTKFFLFLSTLFSRYLIKEFFCLRSIDLSFSSSFYNLSTWTLASLVRPFSLTLSLLSSKETPAWSSKPPKPMATSDDRRRSSMV